MALHESSGAWAVQDRALAMEAAGRPVLFLTVGDPDFDTPIGIVESAITALMAGRTRYSPVAGESGLRAAVARDHSLRTSSVVGVDNVTIFPGAQNALFNVVQVIAEEGDDIIVVEPHYATYTGVIAAAGANAVVVATSFKNGFQVDPAAISKAVSSRTRAVLINSPGNPTGAVLSSETVSGIFDVCARNDLWLISDEVYSDYVYEGDYISAADIVGDYDRLVIVNSVSKRLAMTGWRIGWSITPRDMASRLEILSTAQLFGTPQFAQDAAAWALSHNHPEVACMREAYRMRRDFVIGAIKQVPMLSAVEPQGGMFVLIRVDEISRDGSEFAHALLEEEAVAVVPGIGFGPSAAPYVRVSLTQPLEVLREAFERISKFSQGRVAENRARMSKTRSL